MAYETPEGLRLIDGHLRAEIMPDQEIDVAVLNVDDAQADKLLATHDPLAAMAEANDEALKALLADVETDSEALQALMDDMEPVILPEAGDGGDDFDTTPSEGPTRCQVGDLWIIGGKHRLLVGDCTVKENVERLMGGERARCCFTDPPWNVAIGLDSNPRHRQREGLHNDNLDHAEFSAFLDSVAAILKFSLDGDLYCVLGASEWPTLDLALRSAGYHWSATIIWVKDIFVLGRSKYHRRYEPIWYGWHSSSKSSFGDSRDKDDVWEFPRPRVSEDHPTMKPIQLVETAITNSCAVDDIVIDPFLGSGTTLIAAHRLGRKCYGTEIEPRYADVILKRAEAEGLTCEKQ